MTQAYVGLGANLGDARESLRQAAAELAATAGVHKLCLSRLYRSAPVDADGPDYVNAVAAITTSLNAHALLRVLQGIEDRHGRLRPYRHAPRTLDLDLLLFGEQEIDDSELTVPHPRMHVRAFVLRPLADLVPDLRLPQGELSVLLSACQDQQVSPLEDY